MPGSGDEARELATQESGRYQMRLATALKIEPKPWLALVAEGQRVYAFQLWSTHCVADKSLAFIAQSQHMHAWSPNSPKSGLVLCLRRAVKIAPNSAFTHYALACSLLQSPTTKAVYQEALNQAKIASKLNPTMACNAAVLLWIYEFALPDHKLAQQWKNRLLQLTPDQYMPGDLKKVLPLCK